MTIAGGGDGLFFYLFSEMLLKKTGRGNEATEGVFSIGNCKSCTRPISTNPGSMEAGEYGLARGTCFLACRLELHAVAGLLWISWCVLGGAGFFCFCFFRVLFFLRTHSACCKYVDASYLI